MCFDSASVVLLLSPPKSGERQLMVVQVEKTAVGGGARQRLSRPHRAPINGQID